MQQKFVILFFIAAGNTKFQDKVQMYVYLTVHVFKEEEQE